MEANKFLQLREGARREARERQTMALHDGTVWEATKTKAQNVRLKVRGGGPREGYRLTDPLSPLIVLPPPTRSPTSHPPLPACLPACLPPTHPLARPPTHPLTHPPTHPCLPSQTVKAELKGKSDYLKAYDEKLRQLASLSASEREADSNKRVGLRQTQHSFEEAQRTKKEADAYRPSMGGETSMAAKLLAMGQGQGLTVE